MSADRDTGVALEVRQLSVRYGDVAALSEVSVSVAPGEVLALLGPSGSGKSTLLAAVAGFLPPSAGEVWLRGERVASPGSVVPPERRDLGVVFQSYALWPHLSAVDTVAYPARRRRVGRAQARREALSILDRLHVGHLADRRPAELSGGEQQRVGLARALASQASLYLFDEPTAHLDTHVRGVFLEELLTRQLATGAGGLYATHDAEEALGLADRVALLDAGRVVQVGTPGQVYAEPVNRWAARLTGPMSAVTAKVLDATADGCTIDLAGNAVTVRCPGRSAPAAGTTEFLVRPGWARLGGDLTGRVRSVWFRGPHSDHLVETPVGDVLIREPGPPHESVGTAVAWSLERVWELGDEGSPVAQPSILAGPE
ncbi:MAG: ABC transporter ATP-binding protein [Nocardioidaceae bacterium]|nr:ABC transporter ATP-binding protein [Nocardioidaceae bacterium]